MLDFDSLALCIFDEQMHRRNENGFRMLFEDRESPLDTNCNTHSVWIIVLTTTQDSI